MEDNISPLHSSFHVEYVKYEKFLLVVKEPNFVYPSKQPKRRLWQVNLWNLHGLETKPTHIWGELICLPMHPNDVAKTTFLLILLGKPSKNQRDSPFSFKLSLHYRWEYVVQELSFLPQISDRSYCMVSLIS